MNSKAFIDLLKEVHDQGDIEFDVRSYSGRGMYGKECVAITTDSHVSAWTIALAIADMNGGNMDLFGLGDPREDSMGLGRVYYWPQLEWPEGVENIGEYAQEDEL